MHFTTSVRGTSVPHLAPLTCQHCGVIDEPAIGPGNGPHAYRATCRHCGQFSQWLSKFPPDERQARRQIARAEAMARTSPSAKQLTYLASLGDSGPPPATMLEASQRIDVLTGKGTK